MGTVNCKIRVANKAALAAQAPLADTRAAEETQHMDTGGDHDAAAPAAATTPAPTEEPTATAPAANDEVTVPIAAKQPSLVSLPGVSLKERQAIAMWPTSVSYKIWHGEMDYPQSWLNAVEWVQRQEDEPFPVYTASPSSTDG
jgi:hypothetical protein